MNIRSHIEERIDGTNVDCNEFGDIIIYLLNHGVIVRPNRGTHSEKDPQIEGTLYDKFVRVKEEAIDYLSIIGMGVYHNEEFQSIRVYAPDAKYPHDNEEKEEGSSLMRFAINKDLSASLIICYALYEEKRNEGKLEDDFTAVVSQFEFMSAIGIMLGVDYDSTRGKVAKEEIYKALKRMRAINYNKEFLSSTEAPLIIRPLIYDIVLEDTVKNAIVEIEKQKEVKHEN